LFQSSGLKEIEAEGVVQVYLLSDHRRDQEEIKEQLATEASVLDQNTTAMLIQGGMSASALEEFHRLATERLAKYSDSAQKVQGNAYLRVMSVDVVALGKKQE
jgi:hypothetical protein